MQYEEFLRVYAVRAPNLMWFLGAGTSASAGIPTASALIWQFKRTLYCAAQHVSVKSCEDLSSASVRGKLQAYFDAIGTFPPENSPDEYAFYFESTYGDAADRRAVIDKYVSGASPSFGHRVIAGLLRLGKARIIWTPNFDRLIEDSAVRAFGGTAKIVVASLDSASLAIEAMNEGRWPLIGKLHGDFQSRRLKNTAEELREQDVELRRALVESCKRYGLIVVGYSGRDQSVMSALAESVSDGRGYPGGLFWFHRPQDPLFEGVSSLIKNAASTGIQAHVIEVQTFDELMGDLLRQSDDIPSGVLSEIGESASRLTDISPEPPGKTWPVIRMNALQLLEWPSVCRRVECTIGGAKEVRAAAAKADVIVGRRNVGILAFGSDEEVRKAFSSFKITGFDFHSIEASRLRYESVELGIIRDAFARCVTRHRPLFAQRRGSQYILGVKQDTSSPELNPLEQITTTLNGVLPATNLRWAETVRVRIEYRLGRMWLLFEPTIWFEHTDNDDQRYTLAEFVGQRMAGRFNSQWNSLIATWGKILAGNSTRMSAFDTSAGADASFTLATTTAFSRRSQRR
ncbi:MAG: hypothetical protein AUG89_12345 [Acidobacteria bacterium 13_1_20CM_4_56_7]|nr:MAG: hypothetical protein AUG89_12345 [Acidobacteria bacterium 13_1_20CM_4_56_7]